jgi:hypothetical protein
MHCIGAHEQDSCQRVDAESGAEKGPIAAEMLSGL